MKKTFAFYCHLCETFIHLYCFTNINNELPRSDNTSGSNLINEFVTDEQPSFPPAQAASIPISLFLELLMLSNSSLDVKTYGGLQTTIIHRIEIIKVIFRCITRK